MHFEELFEVNLEVAQLLLSASPVAPEKARVLQSSSVQKQVSTVAAASVAAIRPQRFQAPSAANWPVSFNPTGAKMWGALQRARAALPFATASGAHQKGIKFKAPKKTPSNDDF